jgi:eukaryotic-like serine/threonine-protein kinase
MLQKCSGCGAELPAGSKLGACPKCLLAVALDAGAQVASGPEPEVGDRIGPYKLLEKIGEGGCGLVYMAEQQEPIRRRVALKLIKPGMDSREVIARFEVERQALALMDHPNIARIFDAGTTESGRPYFVMELVRGIRVTDYCDSHSLSTRERLDLFVLISNAVHHAHQKGIIHRDLKPSNILVTVNDSVPVPKIIDFGIAKATQQPLTDKTLFTRFNQLLGTPAYMSPEQAELTSLDIDTRADIYSLGVLLYELLTGRTPFDSKELLKAGLENMLRIIRETEPPRPSARLSTLDAAHLTIVARQRHTEPPKLIHSVRGDLDWIVMKCLEKDRMRRYASASALAEDIHCHLVDRPVEASPPSVRYRVHRFVRRNRMLAGSATLILAALLAGVIVSSRLAAVAVRERNKAWRAGIGESFQRRVAETNATKARQQLIRLDVANGVRAMENDDWFGALLWFTEALRLDQPGSRSEEMHRHRIGAILNYSPRPVRIWFQEGAVNDVAFSPDGRWALTASRDNTARLWDVRTGQPGRTLRHGTNVSRAMFSADGRRVLTVSDDGIVAVWDSGSGQLAGPRMDLRYRVSGALLSPDGRRAFTLGNPAQTNLTADPDGQDEIRIWDTAAGVQVRSPFFQRKRRITALALSPDGQWLAAAIAGATIVWNLSEPAAIQFRHGTDDKAIRIPGLTPGNTAAPLETLLPEIPPVARAGEQGPAVACVAFTPNSQRLLIAYQDGSGRVWPLAGGKPIELQRDKRRERSWAQAAFFSPDGERLMLTGDDGYAAFWDACSGEKRSQVKGRSFTPTGFSSDGRFLLLYSGQMWEIEADEAIPPRIPNAHISAFSPDGVTLLTGGLDGSVRLWNLAGGFPRQKPLKHDRASVSSQRPLAAEPGPQNTRERMRESLASHFSDLRHAAFTADGRQIATVIWNGAARVWDTSTGEAITPFLTLPCMLEFAAFSQDGTRVVIAGGNPPVFENGLARVWETSTGQPLSPVIEHSQQFISAVFSPDKRWVITRTSSGTQVWDASTAKPAQLPAGHHAVLRSVAFSRDGKGLAICRPGNGPQAAGYETQIWNTDTRRLMGTLSNETNEISRVEFSPDGQWLVTLKEGPGKYDVAVRLWTAATGLPVTPWIHRLGFSPDVNFSPDGQWLIVATVGLTVIELPIGRVIDATAWRGLNLTPQAITLDGQRIATFQRHELRVYDSITGEPLTPVLRSDTPLNGSSDRFSPDGTLLIVGGAEKAQLWPLPKEGRPVEELVLLAQLLAGRRINASGNLVTWPHTEAAPLWEKLRSSYPETFTVTANQVRHWRERIIEASENEQHWFAALFHLELLVKDHPDDSRLRLLLARARDRASASELSP